MSRTSGRTCRLLTSIRTTPHVRRRPPQLSLMGLGRYSPSAVAGPRSVGGASPSRVHPKGVGWSRTTSMPRDSDCGAGRITSAPSERSVSRALGRGISRAATLGGEPLPLESACLFCALRVANDHREVSEKGCEKCTEMDCAGKSTCDLVSARGRRILLAGRTAVELAETSLLGPVLPSH